MEKENSKDKNFIIFNSIKIQTLIQDPLMQSEWYKDPHVSCVFKTIDNKNFIFYPRSDFTVKGYEFIYSNSKKNFVIIENEYCLLKGFTNSITLIKHYVLNINQLNINDFILSGCENKLTLWKYSKTNDFY